MLFPVMEAHDIPREGGSISMMLLEHKEGRGHVRSMQLAVSLIEAHTRPG